MNTASNDRPQLPVWRLVRHSYEDLLGNLNGFVAVAGLWILLAWPATLALAWSRGWLAAVAGVLAPILILIAHPAVSVAWHRHVIMAAALAPPLAPVNRRVLRYLLWGIVISLLASLPATAVALLVGVVFGTLAPGSVEEGAGPVILASLVPLALLLVGAVIWIRLALVLPAIAVDYQMPLKRSFALMQGNVLRFLAGAILLVVPLLIAGVPIALLALLFGAAGEEVAVEGEVVPAFNLSDAVIGLLNLILQFTGTVVYTAYLSFAYLHLVGRQSAAEAAPRP